MGQGAGAVGQRAGPDPGGHRREVRRALSTSPTPGATPVTLAFAPREGWASAGPVLRGLAVGYPVLAVAIVLAAAATQEGLVTALVVAWIPCTAAAARILRPYPPGGAPLERRVRHGLAATAAAVGCGFVLAMAVLVPVDLDVQRPGAVDNDWVVGFALLALWALLLAIVTILWALIASWSRALRQQR